MRTESMKQALAVFWETGMLLKETGATKERAHAHTRWRKGCCMLMKRIKRGKYEEKNMLPVPASECSERNREALVC